MQVAEYDRLINKEHFVVDFSPAVRVPGQGTVLKDLGFRERPDHNIGITNAPVAMHTARDSRTGDNVFFVSVGYPAAGLGLQDILVNTSNADNYNGTKVERFTSQEDWHMPDFARDPEHREYEESRDLHRRHRNIPGYMEFHILNRRRWLQASDVSIHDDFFTSFFASHGEIRFVDTREFLYGQSYLREKERHGWPIFGRYERDPYLWNKDPFKEEFALMSWNSEGGPLLLLDPMSGKGFRQYLEKEPVAIKIPPPGKNVAVSGEGITANIALGEIDEGGFYQVDDVNMTFPPDYTEHALYPLIAWREKESGEKSFLNQLAARRLLPVHLQRPGQDVFLGRVLLSYLQPDVSGNYEEYRGYSGPKPKGGQQMRAGQMPILVSQPEHVIESLSTDLVVGLERTIVSFV